MCYPRHYCIIQTSRSSGFVTLEKIINARDHLLALSVSLCRRHTIILFPPSPFSLFTPVQVVSRFPLLNTEHVWPRAQIHNFIYSILPNTCFRFQNEFIYVIKWNSSCDTLTGIINYHIPTSYVILNLSNKLIYLARTWLMYGFCVYRSGINQFIGIPIKWRPLSLTQRKAAQGQQQQNLHVTYEFKKIHFKLS